jgi:uncharacterized RDD family membrane protein YckC
MKVGFCSKGCATLHKTKGKSGDNVYCSKCGAATADGVAFCGSCGQRLSVAAVTASAPVTAPAPAGAPAYAAVPRVEYAGFWVRFLAFVIDTVVMSLGVILVLIPLIFLTGLGALLSSIHPDEDLNDAGIFLIFGVIFLCATVSLAVTWLYHAWMESSEWQATVGKRALGLVVTDMAGQRISFGRATGRHFGKIITNMVPALIGYIMAGFTAKKQALHDMIADCLILRRG